MKKKKLISWLLGVALVIPMSFFVEGYSPGQIVYAADNQEVVVAGQRISIGLSENETQKTLSIRDSDKKTEIGNLTWTDENTTYTLSGASGTLTLSGSDRSKDDVSIGYDPDAINKRISAIDTTITGVENNLKSILANANGTAEIKDVREGQTFSSSKGVGLTGTMTKVKTEDISIVSIDGTNIKVTVKSGSQDHYKYVDNSENSGKVISLLDIKDGNDKTIAIGNAVESQVLEGKTFSNNSGFNKTGTMPNRGVKTDDVPGINDTDPTIPVWPGTLLQYATNTDGGKIIAICPPEGYYGGADSAYVGAPASDYGNAAQNQVLCDRTFTSEDGLAIPGTMPNNGAWTSKSSGKGNLTIPEGYHNGEGYVDLSGSYNEGYNQAKEDLKDQLTNGTAEIVYTYHHHSGSSSAGGGCYTKAVYHTHTDSCYNWTHTHNSGCAGHSVWVDWVPGVEPYWGYVYTCGDPPNTKGSLKCKLPTSSDGKPAYYELACGYNEGEIVKADIVYK